MSLSTTTPMLSVNHAATATAVARKMSVGLIRYLVEKIVVAAMNNIEIAA
jgi:hypothetical protein